MPISKKDVEKVPMMIKLVVFIFLGGVVIGGVWLAQQVSLEDGAVITSKLANYNADVVADVIVSACYINDSGEQMKVFYDYKFSDLSRKTAIIGNFNEYCASLREKKWEPVMHCPVSVSQYIYCDDKDCASI